jgi:hypothetical protein
MPAGLAQASTSPNPGPVQQGPDRLTGGAFRLVLHSPDFWPVGVTPTGMPVRSCWWVSDESEL